MAMMKAVRIHHYGPPDVLVYEDAPRPEPGPGEILVRVHAAGVNPVDGKIRRGDFQAQRPADFPLILGNDVAGIVEALGAEVTDFQVGEAVCAYIPGNGYAEYAAFAARAAAHKPESLDFVTAAALPVVSVTAWQALFDQAHLTAGQRVLIHGGSGGVGHIAVQLAKNAGAYVIATASTRNQAFLRELGVDEAIDYTTARFEEVVQAVDVVLDTQGGETQDRSWGILKPGGVLVCTVSPQTAQAGEAHGKRGVFFSAEPSGAQLAKIAALCDTGKVRVDVETVLPLSEARQAHEMSAQGHGRGKIVLQVL